MGANHAIIFTAFKLVVLSVGLNLGVHLLSLLANHAGLVHQFQAGEDSQLPVWPQHTRVASSTRDQKSKNYANKLGIKEMVSRCYYKMKINPKAFTIPILTAIT